jgi:hypothetical protein
MLFQEGIYSFINVSETNKQVGTATFINRSSVVSCSPVFSKDRVLAVEVVTRNTTSSSKLLITNVYGDARHDAGTITQIFSNLEEVMNLCDENTVLVMGGDWNCILKPSDASSSKLPSNKLIDFVRRHSILDVEDVINGKSIHTYPCGRRECASSRIDFFLTNDNAITDCTCYTTFKQYIVPADHKMVTLNISIRITRRRVNDYHLDRYNLVEFNDDNKET